MNNQLYEDVYNIGHIIREILRQELNTNILTDQLENDILNMQNIITNKILEIRPDSNYKNSNVTKSSIGLNQVLNGTQVLESNKASLSEAIAGTNNTKWMTPQSTLESIEANGSGGSGGSSLTRIERLSHSWLYGD